MKQFKSCALSLGLAILATGCDNASIDIDADSPAPMATTLGGAASLGVVTDADVNFYQADGTTLIGTGSTGADGAVNVTVTSSYAGPVVVEVLGDDIDAMYFDEAAGTLRPFPAGARLRALAPAPGSSIAVTTLTELAYQTAVNDGLFPLTVTEVNAANEAIRAALAPGLSSITSLPTPVGATTAAGSLTNTDAGRYALYLAALATVAASEPSPALAVLSALVADAADGAIDASVANAPYSDFLSDMAAALTTAANTYANADLQANASQLAPASTQVSTSGGGGGNAGPNGTTAPGTVNAGLVSQYTLTATENQSGSPYADGDMVMVIVSDTTLQIGEGPVLTDPFVREIGGSPQTSEIIWLDTAANLEYALSDNATGAFNEINIGDASNPLSQGIPSFLGQLVDQSSGGGEGPAGIELVTALAGTYAVDTVLDGTHTRGTVVIDENGAVDYDDGIQFGPSDYQAVFDRIDCCMRVGIQMVVQGDGNQPTYDLYLDGDGNLERVRFLTDGLDSPGSEVAVSLQGAESNDPEVGNNGPAALANNGVTGIVDGVEYTSPDDIVLMDNGNTFYLQATGPSSQWRLTVTKAAGTYECADDASAADAVKLQHLQGAGTGPDAGVGSQDGQCTIKVIQAGPIVEGYFTGSLIANDNVTQLPVTDGYFYYDPATPNASGNPSDDAALAMGETGVSGRVDGIRTTIVSASPYNDMGNGYFGLAVTDTQGPDNATRRWTMRAPLEVGTHACRFAGNDEPVNTEISLNDGVDFFAVSGDTGCEITVTSISGGLLEATFSGTAAVFRDNRLESVAIESGVVRLSAP